MHMPVLATQAPDTLIRFLMTDIDVVSQIRELNLEPLQLCDAPAVFLNEDIAAEPWRCFECHTGGAIEELPRSLFFKREERMVGPYFSRLGTVAGASKGVDVCRLERLIFQRLSVCSQIAAEDPKLRRGPSAAKPVIAIATRAPSDHIESYRASMSFRDLFKARRGAVTERSSLNCQSSERPRHQGR